MEKKSRLTGGAEVCEPMPMPCHALGLGLRRERSSKQCENFYACRNSLIAMTLTDRGWSIGCTEGPHQRGGIIAVTDKATDVESGAGEKFCPAQRNDPCPWERRWRALIHWRGGCAPQRHGRHRRGGARALLPAVAADDIAFLLGCGNCGYPAPRGTGGRARWRRSARRWRGKTARSGLRSAARQLHAKSVASAGASGAARACHRSRARHWRGLTAVPHHDRYLRVL